MQIFGVQIDTLDASVDRWANFFDGLLEILLRFLYLLDDIVFQALLRLAWSNPEDVLLTFKDFLEIQQPDVISDKHDLLT